MLSLYLDYYSMPESTCIYNVDLVFRLMSKQKSFYIRCADKEERDSWYQDLNNYIRCVYVYNSIYLYTYLFFVYRLYQQKAIQLKFLSEYLIEVNTAPMRVLFRGDITECQLCCRAFNLFTRKHHCRSCGKCVW